uniref:Pepco domain-containing protein n=1 Tax=Candidatus Kentrum sp. LFY TaxID=2126342 RepID=A0A450V941_9GAMM|nr:MAG: hypothetical protein BECKLFY1418A_GA0070994_11428 [Candidatus Kentron sp. LFY]
MKYKLIQVLVDSDAHGQYSAEINGAKSSRSQIEALVRGSLSKIVNIESKKLCEDLSLNVGALIEALENLEIDESNYSIDTATINLGITSSGKVALLSMLERTHTPSVGIQLQLRRIK